MTIRSACKPVTAKETTGTINNLLPIERGKRRQNGAGQHVTAVRALIAKNAIIKQIDTDTTANPRNGDLNANILR